MMHRLRDVMGQRDALYELRDVVELDETFFQPKETMKKKTNH
jgi:hypothetical protein